MLTDDDLGRIRKIVREEVARALRRDQPTPAPQLDEKADAALRERVRADIAEARRESAERAARPIPDGPFVDRYDAARLLDVMMDTVTAYARKGRLTKHKVKGKLLVSRSEVDAILATRTKH